MSFLAPLGFIGLLGVLALILIYILKPNYQQKFISSTFVWRLSLRYKKKKLPINRFRNILVLICQILILSILATLLATPVVRAAVPEEKTEKVAIIDASANMLAGDGTETRFERAVARVKSLVTETFDGEGTVSVILAGTQASFVAQRATSDLRRDVYEALDDLVTPGDLKCSFAAGDVNGAMTLAEQVVTENPKAEILFYTATNYIDKGGVQIVSVSEEDEWNAAILNCTSELVDNYYAFTVDVASYHRNTDVLLCLDIYDANDVEGNTVRLTRPIRCDNDETQRWTFTAEEMPDLQKVFSYSYVHAYLADTEDSFSYDNSYYLYNGTRETIRVLYASSRPNPFISSVLMNLRDSVRGEWVLDLTEIKPRDEEGKPESLPVEGYDIYIFEHDLVPKVMPTDGVVFLVDPSYAPENGGFALGRVVDGANANLTAGETHPITSYLTPDNIYVNRYQRVIMSDGFTPLWYCGGDPVLLVKNEPDCKVIVLTVNLNYSDLAVSMDFPMLFRNIFDYFEPSTVSNSVAEVNSKVTLNARGTSLTVSGAGIHRDYTEFPAELTVEKPGTYTLTQTLLSGKQAIDSLYVKVPNAESNIFQEVDMLESPYTDANHQAQDLDLLFYFAVALVALLFAEWWLQSREQF